MKGIFGNLHVKRIKTNKDWTKKIRAIIGFLSMWASHDMEKRLSVALSLMTTHNINYKEMLVEDQAYCLENYELVKSSVLKQQFEDTLSCLNGPLHKRVLHVENYVKGPKVVLLGMKNCTEHSALKRLDQFVFYNMSWTSPNGSLYDDYDHDDSFEVPGNGNSEFYHIPCGLPTAMRKKVQEVVTTVVNNFLVVAIFPSSQVFLFEPRSMKWEEIASVPRLKDFSIVSVKKRLFAVGGKGRKIQDSTIQEYNFDDNTWRVVGSLPACITMPFLVVKDNKIYEMGRNCICSPSKRLFNCIC